MKGFVYILQSERNDRYYIGSTNDLSRRLVEHNLGRVKYTAPTIPFKLVFSQEYENLHLARTKERALKNKKSKIIIEKIIRSGKMTL